MQFATFDRDRLGIVNADQIADITDLVREPAAYVGRSAMRMLIERWHELSPSLERRRRHLDWRPLSDVQLGPVVPDPSKVVAAPVNYVDHMHEMSEDFHISALGVFLKAPSSVVGTDQQILLPYFDRRFDQEGELALVIGRRARHVSQAEAPNHIFGYTGCLDVTMRGGEDRSTRKSFDTFTPIGPWVVTSDEFGSPDDVELRCFVNGELRQTANTRDLIWGAAALVAYVSSVMTLEPGDIITTGTPAGVGQIHDGDRVELQLGRLGPLCANVTAQAAVACPTLGVGRGPVPPPAAPSLAS